MSQQRDQYQLYRERLNQRTQLQQTFDQISHQLDSILANNHNNNNNVDLELYIAQLSSLTDDIEKIDNELIELRQSLRNNDRQNRVHELFEQLFSPTTTEQNDDSDSSDDEHNENNDDDNVIRIEPYPYGFTMDDMLQTPSPITVYVDGPRFDFHVPSIPSISPPGILIDAVRTYLQYHPGSVLPNNLEPVEVPLPKDILNAIPIKVFNPDDNNKFDNCTICLCNFEKDEQFRLLPCSHMFHPMCIDTWLAKSVKCPMCKIDLRDTQKKHK